LASAIEGFLYGDAAELVSASGQVGDYFVVELRLAEKLLSLRLASERTPYSYRWAIFREVSLLWFNQTAAEEGDLNLPWDIVGFHCLERENDLWQFNLNGWHTRWSWTSHWPVIEEPE
jgi:hypothetical protein